MAASEALQPPPDENRGPAIIIVQGLFLAICIILVGLRIYVRHHFLKALWWDDLLVVLSTILYIVNFALNVVIVNLGVGRHAVYLQPTDLVQAAMLQYIDEVPLILCIMTARLSFCMLLFKLFAISRPRLWIIRALVALIAATNIASACIILPQCNPTAKLWNPMIPGSCWPPETQVAIGYFNGVVSIVSDLVLALLPIYFLRTIQLSQKVKVGICALLGLGLFTATAAVVRTVLLPQIKADDPTWSLPSVIIWSTLEAGIAIIGATVPTLRPIVSKKARHGSRGYTGHTKGSNKHANVSRTRLAFNTKNKSAPASQSSLAGSNTEPSTDHGFELGHFGQTPGILRTVDIEAYEEPRK